MIDIIREQIKSKIKDNTNGVLNETIDFYSNKTKEQLIQEIVNLKDKINHYEDLCSRRNKRKKECIVELNQLLNNK